MPRAFAGSVDDGALWVGCVLTAGMLTPKPESVFKDECRPVITGNFDELLRRTGRGGARRIGAANSPAIHVNGQMGPGAASSSSVTASASWQKRPPCQPKPRDGRRSLEPKSGHCSAHCKCGMGLTTLRSSPMPPIPSMVWRRAIGVRISVDKNGRSLAVDLL